jgi:hypothetical protein
MSAVPLAKRAAPQAGVPLTVDEYHRMLEAGILEDGAPVELLAGVLVPKIRGEGMTISPPHRLAVQRLARLAPRCEAQGCHLQLHNPITIGSHDEPEPDGALVAGAAEEYAERHPAAGDVGCVIEVADSSPDRDRTLKLRLYAATGIPQYLLVNLVAGHLEVYEEPLGAAGRYRRAATVGRGEVVVLQLPDGATLEVAASEILP